MLSDRAQKPPSTQQGKYVVYDHPLNSQHNDHLPTEHLCEIQKGSISISSINGMIQWLQCMRDSWCLRLLSNKAIGGPGLKDSVAAAAQKLSMHFSTALPARQGREVVAPLQPSSKFDAHD